MNNFIIKDIDEFTEHARIIVYNNFGNDNDLLKESDIANQLSSIDREEIDNLLTHKECKLIVTSLAKKQRNKKNNKERFIINEKIFMNIIDSINSRLVSNILSGLIKKGLIESAYDAELNDFVFWIKEDENAQDNQEPKTNID